MAVRPGFSSRTANARMTDLLQQHLMIAGAEKTTRFIGRMAVSRRMKRLIRRAGNNANIAIFVSLNRRKPGGFPTRKTTRWEVTKRYRSVATGNAMHRGAEQAPALRMRTICDFAVSGVRIRCVAVIVLSFMRKPWIFPEKAIRRRDLAFHTGRKKAKSGQPRKSAFIFIPLLLYCDGKRNFSVA